ncbi:hypothetical protein CPC16_007633 [Podila verticillata]|nr:hypothetical protein CPC16_007633 [Podila verticillata]
MHCASNARIVDFGGWAMPLHYGSQLDEHQAVRTDAGMFDVSHMCVIDIGGTVGSDDVRTFLRYVLANDIDKLKTPGRALYSCMLNAHGGVIDDLIVYLVREDLFRVVVNAATAEQDIVWLNQLNAEGEFGVTLMPRRDLAMIAVQGPHACAKVLKAVPAVRSATEALQPFGFAIVPATPYGEMLLARTGYTGEDGFELIVTADAVTALWLKLAEAGVRPCGLGARDTLRLEAGMNLYGQDMDINTSPLDAGLGWTVELVAARDFVADLQYTESHEWVRLETDGTVTIGITDHAQEALGDIVFLELPTEGTKIAAGKSLAVIESVKAASDIYAPISGEVLEINEKLADEPGAVNADPYAAWLLKLKPSEQAELASLMSAEAYRQSLGG